MTATTGVLRMATAVDTSIAEGYSLANAFTPPASYTVYLLQYASPDGLFPDHMWIRDQSEGVYVLDTSTAGWTWVNIAGQLYYVDLQAEGVTLPTITAGHNYKLTFHLGAANQRQPSNAAANPNLGWTFGGAYYQIGSTGNPAGFASSAAGYGCDLVVSQDGGGGGGLTTPGDVDNSLASWLSSDGATQQHESDGLPSLTYQAVTDSTNGLAAIKGAVNSANTSLATLLQRLSSALVDTINAIPGAVQGVSDQLAAGLQSLSDGLVDLLNGQQATNSGTGGGALGAISGRSGFPTVLWTLVDEVDFTTAKSWDVGADLYVLDVGDIPPYVNTVDVDGASWRPRLGWWAIRNGDHFEDRRFVNWEHCHLVDGGRRMPGVVVRLEPGATGHLQAWQLT